MIANQIAIDEIESHLKKFLKSVEAGEKLIIMKEGKPLAEVKPVASKSPSKMRPYGLCEGDFTVPEGFDMSLPTNIIQEFEGK